MALRALQGPTGGGAPVGGGGTSSPSTIPRWTGPSTLGDSVITQNSTALVTTGSSSATQTTFRVRTVGTANNAPAFSLYREGVNEHAIWAGSGSIRLGFATDPAGYTDAQLLTATKMGIDSSGNVGIGTASPTAYAGYTTLAVNNATNGGLIEIQKAGAVVGYINGVSGMLFLATGANQATIGTAGAGSLVFRTNAADVARIDSAGRLLVGTTGTPVSAQIKAVVAGAGNGGQEWIAAVGGGVAIIPESAGTGSFQTVTGNVGAESYTQSFKAIPTGLDVSFAGYGVKLQGTAGTNNTDPNVLDFYADGGTANSGGVAWTPTLKFGGNTTGITYATQVGRYTRIGNMVFASGYIILSSKGTAVGNATIDGLPAASTLANLYSSASISYLVNVTFASQPVGYIGPGATWMNLTQNVSGGASSSLTNAEFTNTSAIIFSIAYSVN